jgi:tRNA nucleotidyltransferase (CCA-adding enzyme)
VTTDLAGRIRALPGMDRLLPALDGLPPAYLVGGAVRDVLRGAEAVDLDVAVEGNWQLATGKLAERLRGDAVLHDRFGTATVKAGDLVVDLARTRRETYAHPGALPDVEPASLADDLIRRDFTINAMAAGLNAGDLGHLHDPHGGQADLEAGVIRVLHARSFVDDPTRLLRLARYGSRLGFEPEPHTAELARDALADDVLATVSRARIGAELRLTLIEPDPVAALAALGELGALAALDPQLRLDGELARRALAMLPEDGRPEVLLLAVALLPLSLDACRDGASEISSLLDGLEFTAAEREAVLRTAVLAPPLVEHLRDADRPSRLREAAAASTVEGVALAGALAGERPPYGAAEAAHEWLRRWRHVRLAITGDDLLAAGIPPGPEIGRLLAVTLGRRLDGELAAGRDAELQAALEARA